MKGSTESKHTWRIQAIMNKKFGRCKKIYIKKMNNPIRIMRRRLDAFLWINCFSAIKIF